ncbi:MAG: ATP-binding protein [Phycisphaerae bacterium]|jgi:signal transduction histidine kinase/HAMP domain-containing protein
MNCILRNITIKYKLMAIVMLACLTGLVMAGVAFIGWEQNMFRNTIVQNLSTRTEMIADNCKAALAFQDNKDAEKTLQSLHVDTSITFACVYNDKNELFAAYYRPDNKIKTIPREFKKTGFSFGDGFLTVSSPVILDNAIIGTVCLQSDLKLMYTTLKRSIQIIIIVIFISLLAVFLVSTRLQAVISKPILNLAQLAKAVSEKKDYSCRALKESNDEIGLLIDAFNEMLEQIQKRDSELLDAKEGLEVNVQERTAELSKAKQMLQVVMDNIPQSIFWKDRNLVYLGCNTNFARDAGLDKPTDIIGKTDYDLGWKKEEADSFRECDRRVVDSNTSQYHITEQQQQSNGKRAWLDTNKVPLHDENGNVVGIIGTYEDITDRKKADEQLRKLNDDLAEAVNKLEEANQEMKNFVYIASHDLREPLRKITAFGSMLDKSLKDKLATDDAENLRFMIDGAQRMNKMIEGLLVYSRVSSKSQVAQVVDLNEIVKQLQQVELSVLLQEKNVALEIPQPLPVVKVDPAQMRQLMQNLIANGIKYQKKDNIPHITITSKPAANGMVRVEVTDNGIGIKPEYQGGMFVMFKRLHTRSEYEGTGIGLAVCRKIVERHGGQIGIESQEDQGSTFWFTIPVTDAAVTAEAEVAAEKVS